MAEDNTAIVGVTLRIREDLRRSLEEAAKAKRVSLNQEIIDRLEYVRERRSLLAEVMRLAFGERLAGLLLAMGLAMRLVVYNYRRISPDGRHIQSPEAWIDDPKIFDEVVEVAIALLDSAQPDGSKIHLKVTTRDSRTGWWKVENVTTDKEIDALKELLGPAAARMAETATKLDTTERMSRQPLHPNLARIARKTRRPIIPDDK